MPRRRAEHAPPSPHPSPPAPGDSRLLFENDARPVLSALSGALKTLIHAIPGTIEGPRDLQRALNIDYVLAWRTYKVATAEDPAAVGADVARSAAMKGLLEAAKRKRVRANVLEGVRTAYHDFEELVRRHAGEGPKRGRGTRSAAGGRTVFDALIGGVRQGETSALDLVNRRAAFKSNAYIWGMQAQATYRCVIWHRGGGADEIDGLLLSGFTQLQALRPDVPILLKRTSGVKPERTPSQEANAEYQPPTGVHMLPEFCSRSLQNLRAVLNDDGYLDVSLHLDGIGKGAALDCAMLDVMRNANNGIPQDRYRMQVTCVMPAETTLIVMLVPRGWSDPSTLKVTTHGNPAVLESLRRQDPPPFEMPAREHADYLGVDLNALASPDMPRLTEMVTATLREQHWESTEFDIYRCRVRYPVLHAMVHLQVAAR